MHALQENWGAYMSDTLGKKPVRASRPAEVDPRILRHEWPKGKRGPIVEEESSASRRVLQEPTEWISEACWEP